MEPVYPVGSIIYVKRADPQDIQVGEAITFYLNRSTVATHQGTLEIPALELSLPVMDAWSDPDLKLAPCRYKGSAYLDDMIVAGHDYRTHFGNLYRLQTGEEVRSTDAEGNLFAYTVAEREKLAATAVEEMENGDWDLTLFTCAWGGKAREAVRCIRSIEDSAVERDAANQAPHP